MLEEMADDGEVVAATSLMERTACGAGVGRGNVCAVGEEVFDDLELAVRGCASQWGEMAGFGRGEGLENSGHEDRGVDY